MCSPLFAAMLLIAECVSAPEAQEGKLKVIATDLTGQQVSGVQVELFPGESRIADITTNSTSTRVRYGDYRLRVYAKGFSTQWREIRIWQPDTVVRVELPVGTIGCSPPPASIGGKINLDDPKGDVWVKAIPLRGTRGGETRVSPSGYFLVSGLERSTYVVVVMQGEVVLHHQVVKTYPVGTDTSKLTINIRQSR